LVLEELFRDHKRMKKEEMWIGEEMIKSILMKLELVKREIFNIRDWKVKGSYQIDYSAYSDSVQHLINLIERSSWARKDIKFDPLYLSVDELNQHSFRNIVHRVFNNYHLVKIQSDGNCFFRAVIKYFWQNCPQNVEDEASLMIRKLINPSSKLKRKRECYQDRASPKKEMKREPSESNQILTVQNESNYTCYDEFEEAGVNDEETMQNSGVWADHLQVLKLSAYLERSIWLYRYDDLNIKIDENGKLIPGNDYQIRSSYNQLITNELSPITLYFIPEAHYEVLRLRQSNEVQIHKLIERLGVLIGTTETCDIAQTIIVLLFNLLKEVNDIEEFYLILGLIPNVEEAREIKKKRKELITFIHQLKGLIHRIPSSFTSNLEKHGKVQMVLLRIFINDALKKLNKTDGPHFLMAILLKELNSLLFPNEESILSSSQELNNSVLNGTFNIIKV